MAAPPPRPGIPREPRLNINFAPVPVAPIPYVYGPAAPAAPSFLPPLYNRPAAPLSKTISTAEAGLKLLTDRKENRAAALHYDTRVVDLAKDATRLLLTAAANPNDRPARALVHFPDILALCKQSGQVFTVFKQHVLNVPSSYIMAWLPDILNFDNKGGTYHGNGLLHHNGGNGNSGGPATLMGMKFLLQKLATDFPQEVFLRIACRIDLQILCKDTLPESQARELLSVIPENKRRHWQTILDDFPRLCDNGELYRIFVNLAHRIAESEWQRPMKEQELVKLYEKFRKLLFDPNNVGMGTAARTFATTNGQTVAGILGRRCKVRCTDQIEKAVHLPYVKGIMADVMRAFQLYRGTIMRSLELLKVVPPRDTAALVWDGRRGFVPNDEAAMGALSWTEINWRLAQIKRILDGGMPHVILTDSLGHYHPTKPWLARLQAVVTFSLPVGRQPVLTTPSPAHQIDTLFLLARSGRLLSRMHIGWASWI
ncbi:hypothetical protein HDU88_004651 [Geranomyces variabilis]|nr:hypothetical protein HDU88_004651 [Geranomyces variabilis]